MSTIEELYDKKLEELLRQGKIAVTDAVTDDTRSNPIVMTALCTADNAVYAAYKDQYKTAAHKFRLYRRVYNLFIEAHGSPVGEFLAEYLRSLELRLRTQSNKSEHALIIGHIADMLQSDNRASLTESLRDLYAVIRSEQLVCDVLTDLVRDEL